MKYYRREEYTTNSTGLFRDRFMENVALGSKENILSVSYLHETNYFHI